MIGQLDKHAEELRNFLRGILDHLGTIAENTEAEELREEYRDVFAAPDAAGGTSHPIRVEVPAGQAWLIKHWIVGCSVTNLTYADLSVDGPSGLGTTIIDIATPQPGNASAEAISHSELYVRGPAMLQVNAETSGPDSSVILYMQARVFREG